MSKRKSIIKTFSKISLALVLGLGISEVFQQTVLNQDNIVHASSRKQFWFYTKVIRRYTRVVAGRVETTYIIGMYRSDGMLAYTWESAYPV
ncbi:hypothetical protein [Streptococcus cristatus]|uniref:hypothetical protein n=1 Tax=Streptococcus cristatus TaxID=45634 RepID=UPI0011E69A9A|nr:hypothetical protein [Streptococcus cristatus]